MVLTPAARPNHGYPRLSGHGLIFRASDLSPDVHVNAIGAYTAAMCELPPDLLAGAAVVAVDAIDAAMVEAGDLLRAIREGALRRDRLVEIGDLLARPRPRQDGRTVFKSVGVAAQDWAVARLAVERATAAGDLRAGDLRSEGP